jgi:hypothetical protein
VQAKAIVCQETIRIKGEPVQFAAVRVNNQTFIISGKFVKTANLQKEWQDDVANPDEVIQALKSSPAKIDLVKFWQRIPDTKAKYEYYKEWRQIAVIPIRDFKNWWDKQISPKVRNKIRKAQKLGVVIEQVQFDDEFLQGVMAIYKESPVRRGKPFWHYGRDAQSVKKGMSADLDEAILIGAYYQKELIGFIKLLLTDRYAMIVLILDKMSHRDKAPMNGMIAKAVEICANRKISYITYTVWRRGDHGKFQESNGFEKMPVPEYYVPLTIKGALALRLRLHEGIKGAIPEKVMIWLLSWRKKWYAVKYSRNGA